jgi:CheY-like chemotaxis protein
MMALKIAMKKCPQIPFVFCSGGADPRKQEDAFASGAAAWASKDDSFAQLVQVLKRLCPRQEQ